MRVIKAKLEHAKSISEIYNSWVFSNNGVYCADSKGSSVEGRKKWISGHCDKFPVFVVVDGDVVKGWASLSRFSNSNGYDRTAEISIYVSNKHSGEGVGRLLMSELITVATRLGHTCLISKIIDTNKGSIKIHEKNGFELSGKLKNVCFKNNSFHNVCLYQKHINNNVYLG